MNKIHSKVWNRELGQLVVASEFASSDSAGVVQGAAPMRRTLLAAAVAPLLALAVLAGAPAFAQDAGWVASDGTTDLAIAEDGTVTFQGGSNIAVELGGSADAATLEISLNDAVDLGATGSLTVGNTVVTNTGVAIGGNAVVLNGTGLVLATGPSVTTAGINAGNRVITNVTAGTAAGHAVNVGQLDTLRTDALAASADALSAAQGAQSTADDAQSAAAAAQNAADAAAAGWTVSAESGSAANIGPDGTVAFSGDANISVAQSGTEDAGVIDITLNPDLAVTSVTTGNTRVDTDGLVITGGPSITSSGIDAAGNKITNLQNAEISATSTDAVTGQQVHDLFFEGGSAEGIRYFRSNTAAPDAAATGDQSIAIGPNTTAGGDSSLAAGDGAVITETAEGAVALGQGAVAGTENGAVVDGEGSVAIGRGSQAAGNSTVAVGDGAKIEDERVDNAVAVGSGARVSGMESGRAIAIGDQAHASAANATALGAGAQAGGGGATALGADALASGGGSIAIGQANAAAGNGLAAGTGAYVGTGNSIALGVNAGVGTEGNAGEDRTSHIAIGTGAGQNVAGNQTTAIGYSAGDGVTGDDNIALGTEAGGGLHGNNNIAIGIRANDGAGERAQSIAIGGHAAAGSDSVALGDGAQARGNNTVALGKDSNAGANGLALGAHTYADDNNIALGRNSHALISDAAASSYLTGETAANSVVSVGNTQSGYHRRIVNVADGALGHDAVNVNQLKAAQDSVATLVGGNVQLRGDGTYSPIVVDVVGGGTAEFNTVVEAIGAVTSGAVDILPVDAVRYNASGGISNVGAGTAATDAVNVQQMNEAIDERGVKYFSARSTIGANRLNDGATGENSMAVGPEAVAGGDASLAVGYNATVNTGADSAVAIGHSVSSRAVGTTTVGNYSHSYDRGGVAVGQHAVSRGENSIVMGTGAEADPKEGSTVDNAIVIGTGAEATADNGIAIGQESLASEVRAVAHGHNAHGAGVDAQAFGTRAYASGVSSQASGTDAQATGGNAQASGTGAQASGANAVSTGTGARGYANDGIAMGTGAVAGHSNPLPEETRRNINGIAIGNSALSDDRNALALGVDAEARAESATAIGDGAEATAVEAFAAGTGAEATGDQAFAAGTGARATVQSASAFGHGAQATHERSVALGSGAVTAEARGTASHTVDKVTYAYAGTNPTATVSVGDVGAERTITNVAAGRVEADSTDAINGSQLYQTNRAVDALGNNLDTAGQSVAAALGGTSAYDAETHTVTAGLSVRGNNYNNVQDALDYVGQGWNVSAQGGATANVGPNDTVDFRNGDQNIEITRSGTDLTFDLAENIDVTSVDAGGTVVDSSGVSVGDVQLGNTGLVIDDGPSVTTGGINAGGSVITNVAAGVNGTDAVNVNQLNTLANTPLTFAGDAGAPVQRQLGQTVNVVGGADTAASLTNGNIGVVADGNATLSVRLNKDIDLGDDGSVEIGDTTIDSDGLVVDDGAGNRTGVGAGTVTVTANPTTGPQNTITIDANTGTVGGLTNRDIGYDEFADGSGRAATEEQLKQVNDAANAGWNVSVGNEGAVADNNVGPDGVVDFSNTDTNIEITRDGTDLTFDLAADIAVDSVTAGDTVVDTDGVRVGEDVALGDTGLVIDGGPSVTTGGIDAGEMVITNVAPGAVNASSTEAVNGSQLFGVANNVTNIIGGETTIDPDTGAITAGNIGNTGESTIHDAIDAVNTAANAGWNLSAGNENPTNVGPGDSVDLSNTDGNIVVAKADDSNDVTFDLADDLVIENSITVGETYIDGTGVGVGDDVHLGDTGLVIEGGPSVTTGGIDAGSSVITNVEAGVADTDAVNVGQLNDLADTPLTFAGDAGTNVDRRLGQTVNLVGGATNEAALTDGNIGVVANGTDTLTIKLNKDVDLGVDGSLAIGDASLDNDGLEVVDDDGNVTTVAADGATVADDAGNVTTLAADGTTVVDDAGNVTTLAADGTTVNDDAGNTTTVAATGTTVTGDNASTTVEAGVVTVTANPTTGPQNTIVIDANSGTIGGLANTEFDPELTYTGGLAATQEQLSQVNSDLTTAGLDFVGDRGAAVHRNLGQQLSITGGATGALSTGNIGVSTNAAGDGLVVELADNIELTEDGSLTIGDAELDNDGLVVVDDDGNATTVAAGGTTVADDAGNVTTLAADGTTVNDDAGNETTVAATGTTVTGDNASTTVEAGVVTVTANPTTGPQNTIVIDANSGTIGGLANRDIDYDEFADGSGRAATEEQLAQVNQTANAGWNLSAGNENSTNVGPGGSVDLSNTDGNIVVAKADDSNDVTFDLADDLVIENSMTVGETYIDTTGVAIGSDVHLGGTGLVITGGPRVTTAGIHAGDMVIAGVAPGEISATSTDAVNGSQLFGMGDSIVSVIGGNAELNEDGTITTSNIGGTGHDNIDDAIRAANDAANAGWTLTDAEGNDANIGPNGTVSFTGDSNISVVQAGEDQSGEIQITLNRELDVDSITAGNTVIDTDGVRVGEDVHLGDTGLVIEGGPSVTTDGIDAGDSVISNVAAGVEDTDAVNVGQLNQVAGDVSDLGDRMDVVEGDVADLQAGATGPFQVSQEAPLVPPTPTGENSAAGGSGADASGANSTALGNQAVASGANSTAVGQGAEATHDNSVALGQGSATTVGAQTGYDAAYVGSSDSAGEVNVGNRTISGVAPGVAGTDAVNVSQLQGGVNHAVVTANAYTDQRFNQVQNDVWHLHGRVDELERDINAGVATAMAMRQAPYVAGATTYYAGFGTYKGEGALGVSLRRTADNGRWSLEGGFSANRDGAGGYIGVSGVLGSK